MRARPKRGSLVSLRGTYAKISCIIYAVVKVILLASRQPAESRQPGKQIREALSGQIRPGNVQLLELRLFPLDSLDVLALESSLLGKEAAHLPATLEQDAERRSRHFGTVVDGQAFQLIHRNDHNRDLK